MSYPDCFGVSCAYVFQKNDLFIIYLLLSID